MNSHVILLKCLIDVGEVDLAIEHIKSIRSNFSSSFQNIINELMASLSTSASLQPVTRLISYLNSQGIVHNVGPWMGLMEHNYA